MLIYFGYDISNIDLSFEHKTQCPKCVSEKNGDRSCDNLHVYGLDENGKIGGFRCFACGYSMNSESYKSSNTNGVGVKELKLKFVNKKCK